MEVIVQIDSVIIYITDVLGEAKYEYLFFFISTVWQHRGRSNPDECCLS